jgi:hypothetical protein
MKNRVKLLCQKNGIDSYKEFALKFGIGEIKAQAIWNEEAVLEFELLEHLRKFFNCSTAYLLCLTENEA